MGKTLQVFYEGRVQGVGFRYTARRVAAGYDVAGYVRNLPDGRVELVASGDDEEVDGFLQGVRESELAGHMATEEVGEIGKPAGLRGFEIRFSQTAVTSEGIPGHSSLPLASSARKMGVGKMGRTGL